jgi:hypothetical protein
MKKSCVAILLVLVMAAPAIAAKVKPWKATSMNLRVYKDVLVGAFVCPVTPHGGSCEYCSFQILGVCFGWTTVPIQYQQLAAYEREVTVADVGETIRVAGSLYSETPQDIEYMMTVRLNNKVIYETEQLPAAITSGESRIQFDNFTFDEPGMYDFTLQVVYGGSKLKNVSTRVYVSASVSLAEGIEETEDAVSY